MNQHKLIFYTLVGLLICTPLGLVNCGDSDKTAQNTTPDNPDNGNTPDDPNNGSNTFQLDASAFTANGQLIFVTNKTSSEQVPALIRVPSGTGPFPVVKIDHGCGGLWKTRGITQDQMTIENLGGSYPEWFKFLPEGKTPAGSPIFDKNGQPLKLAVLMIDGYSTRGTSPDANVECDDLAITREELLLRRREDHLAAVALLKTIAQIDADQIVSIGFSNGGSNQIFSNLIIDTETRSDDVVFFGAWYPGCYLQGQAPAPDEEVYLHTKMALFMGFNDDLKSDCEERALTVNTFATSANTPKITYNNVLAQDTIDYVLPFADANHSFDQEDLPENASDLGNDAQKYARYQELISNADLTTLLSEFSADLNHDQQARLKAYQVMFYNDQWFDTLTAN